MNPPLFCVIIQSFAIALLFYLLVYSTLQKPSAMQKHLAVLIIACILFLSGYLVRLYATNVEAAMIGAGITYTGQPFVLLSAMMLISTFYGYKVPNWLFIFLAFLASLVPLVVFSNSAHYLFYATVEFNEAAKFSPLVITHGPLYNLNILYAGSLFITDVIMVVHGFHRSNSLIKRSLSFYTILMLLSGVTGYVLYFLKVTNGYDTTMLGIALGVIFLFILFFRCRIFDIVDKAKDYALDHSSDGLIIYDDSNQIVYQNDMAEILLQNDMSKELFEGLPEGNNRIDANGQNYNVNVKILSHGKGIIGRSIKIQDVTDSVHQKDLLEDAVRKATDHIEYLQRKYFATMASVVEARSLETGDHIKRVRIYTDMIAHSLRDMGKHADVLTDEYINTLALSAPLHDIGKISIPDAILLKPGRLDPDEFEIMKTHAAKGADIIENTMKDLESEDYISLASKTARYHHERWDGTGYPEGLIGEQIPLCARIVALADCYDAMTSKRCYKDAFPDEEALRTIQEESGSHFDPDVVEAFLHCRSEHS